MITSVSNDLFVDENNTYDGGDFKVLPINQYNDIQIADDSDEMLIFAFDDTGNDYSNNKFSIF